METLPKNIRHIPELFMYIRDKDKETKISMLREFSQRGGNMSRVLYEVVRFTYNPDLIMQLPEGLPKIREMNYSDYRNCPVSLYKFFKQRVPRFIDIKDYKYISNDFKREKIFIQTLESMFKDNVELIGQIKDKKITAYGRWINESLFREAFPEWFTWQTSDKDLDKEEETDVQQENQEQKDPSVKQSESKEKNSKSEATPRKKRKYVKKKAQSKPTGKRRGRPPKKKPVE